MANTPIRSLYTDLKLRSADAVKGLEAYARKWAATVKLVEAAATAVEKAADRAGAAMARVSGAAATVRASVPRGGAGGGGSGGGGGVGSRGARDPLDAIIRENRKQAAAADRAAAQAGRVDRKRAGASAAEAGMRQGAVAINDATAALGKFASASDRAKAKVADLDAQVQRNRKDMADLRAEVVRTGDADGTLTAKVRGLAVETGIASNKLQGARKELRAFEGGLIDAIKKASIGKITVQAFGTAIGNLAADTIKGAITGITRGLAGAVSESVKLSMTFEKNLVDVRKVARGADDTDEGFARITKGIKDASKELGVMPGEVAELTAQLTGAFSGKEDLVALTGDVTKVGVAWDISGKQAGEFFKQTSAGLQTSATETKSLFGTINELGNQFGIKSADIAEAVTRSAGVLKGAGISGETGAAINATLIKAGASAEVAATGVRTFIARLGAGEAATDKQRKAFTALGLSAEAVAKNLASGDAARAEKQIKEVVGALVEMGEKAPEKRMATLIELFGSESIGSIGAAASTTEALADAFKISNDRVAAATSVQKEYDRVSDTSAQRVAKLKANIAVLAIELGDKLLPYVDKVVEFLTSPEGQEWGAKAVETAASAITGLASGVATLAGFLANLADTFGTTTLAVVGLGIAASALVGPFGLALAAGVAAGVGIAAAFKSAYDEIAGTTDLIDVAVAKARQVALEAQGKELDAEFQGGAEKSNRSARVAGLEKKYRDQLIARGVSADQADKQVSTLSMAVVGANRSLGGGTEEERVAEWEKRVAASESTPAAEAGGVSPRSANSSEMAEFRRLDSIPADKRTPSQEKRLSILSKLVDRKKTRRGSGRKPKQHKQTKMDRQLAAIDGDVAGVLTRGGEADAGGDAMVHDDVLSRGVLARSTGGSDGGGASLGPGPNIKNDYTYINVTTTVPIDARSSSPVPENIRAAGMEVGSTTSGMVLKGAQQLIAARNSGGVVRGPAA